MSKIDDFINKLCPNGVEYRYLKELCKFNRGSSITSKTALMGEVPVVSGGQKPAFFHNIANRPPNTITIAGSGAYAGFVSFWNEPIFCADAFSVDIIDEKILNKRYLYHFLLNNQNKIFSKKKGAGIPHVYGKDIENLCIPVPSLEVQNEIVHILDDFTLLSAELSAELKARNKQYNYYLHHLLDIKDGNEMTIGDIYDFKYGTGNTIPEGGGKYPVYGSNGMVGYYSEFNSEDSPVIGHIGAYAGIVNWASGKHFVTYNGVICKHKNINVNKKYAYYILLTQDFIGEQKGAQPFVSYDTLKKPIVKIPPMKEQERIVNILNRFDKLCNDISHGLPAEIEARRKQYEYYRNKLLNFKELKVEE